MTTKTQLPLQYFGQGAAVSTLSRWAPFIDHMQIEPETRISNTDCIKIKLKRRETTSRTQCRRFKSTETIDGRRFHGKFRQQETLNKTIEKCKSKERLLCDAVSVARGGIYNLRCFKWPNAKSLMVSLLADPQTPKNHLIFNGHGDRFALPPVRSTLGVMSRFIFTMSQYWCRCDVCTQAQFCE